MDDDDHIHFGRAVLDVLYVALCVFFFFSLLCRRFLLYFSYFLIRLLLYDLRCVSEGQASPLNGANHFHPAEKEGSVTLEATRQLKHFISWQGKYTSSAVCNILNFAYDFLLYKNKRGRLSLVFFLSSFRLFGIRRRICWYRIRQGNQVHPYEMLWVIQFVFGKDTKPFTDQLICECRQHSSPTGNSCITTTKLNGNETIDNLLFSRNPELILNRTQTQKKQIRREKQHI